MHYKFDGDPSKPVIIFSNSLGTNLSMWNSVVDKLKDHFYILRYDTRGHGGSPFINSAEPSVADLAKDVIQLIDSLGIVKAWFCGISLGGITGLKLAINYPEYFHGFILSNTSAKIASSGIWNNRVAQIKAFGLAPVAQGSAARWFTEEFIKMNSDIVNAMTGELNSSSPEGYCFCCEALSREDLWKEIFQISQPLQLIAGEFDMITTVKESQRMRDLIKDSSLEIISANHLANIEKPDEFAEIIIKFYRARISQ